MICRHQFIKVSEATRPRPGSMSLHAGIQGAIVACVNCGHTRAVWADGVVEIKFEGGTQIDEDAAHDITL